MFIKKCCTLLMCGMAMSWLATDQALAVTYAATKTELWDSVALDKAETSGSLAGFVVTNTNDSGIGSFRQAILDANASPGMDNITFNIPLNAANHLYYMDNGTTGFALPVPTFLNDGAIADFDNDYPGGAAAGYSWYRIQLTSTEFPTITEAVDIDATTQSGFTNKPIVELDGSLLVGGGMEGIRISSGASTVRGLVINGFSSDGIQLVVNGENTIVGNHIGTDVTGLVEVDNAHGILVSSDSNGNTIGGASASDRNVISGSQINVWINGTKNNIVQGNYIGTDVTGTADLGDGLWGVQLSAGANSNTVGGSVAGAGNVISGNDLIGVNITGAGTSSNVVTGNYIGTDASGTVAVPNTGDGISINSGATNNTIGGSLANERNIISGNSGDGIQFTGGNTNQVQGNYIGTDITGTLDLGNSQAGINIANSSTGNTIGGSTATRNIISGNVGSGVSVSSADGNTVKGNYIGTDFNGTSAIKNNGGIQINSGDNNQIGGSSGGEGNLISGNSSAGLWIYNTSTGNTVEGNTIGLNATQSAQIPNTRAITINGSATNNIIGGTAAGAGNVISGNSFEGIIISGAGTTGNTIQGNSIGTDGTGTLDLGNNANGIIIQSGATNNTIGGTTTGASNIIAFNGNAALEYGIYVSGATSITNLISGNQIYENFDAGIKLDGSGANNNKLVPTITSVISGGSDYTAIATVENNDIIEFFRVNNSASPVVMTDGSGAGEGYLFLGRCIDNGACSGPHIQALADADAALGTVEATLLSSGISTGDEVTATATDGTNNTSEFAINVASMFAGAFVVTNTSNSGPGSLRQAIIDANANGGTDNITFNISGAGPHTIQPTSALPDIIDPVVIDGTTQSGAQCNTVAAPGVSDAVLLIEIDGSLAGANVTGLTVSAGSSTIRGLVINRFDNNGIVLNSNDNVVECNYIGTDTSGTLDLGNTDDGVQMGPGDSNNTIGGATPQARNLISGNDDDGVAIRDTGTTGNRVIGNFIGTDVTGTLALGNDGDGIQIYLGATGNTIGGTTSGSRNLISANQSNGVNLVDANTSGNQIQGNYIGTDVTGTLDLGNNSRGININGSPNNTIGGAIPAARNLISGNADYGILLFGTSTTGTVIKGNYIGTDVTGTLTLGNDTDGIHINFGASSNTIGGSAANERNILSGNGNDGIELGRSGTDNNVVIGNYIGTNVTGTLALSNTRHGVVIYDEATNNIIGGSGAGEKNLISGNGDRGVVIDGNNMPTTTGNQVRGNYIGTDVTGTIAIGNAVDGIQIFGGAVGNIIGGDRTASEGNLISGNSSGSGILIEGNTTDGNIIQGNLIGTDISGSSSLMNFHGIFNDGAPNTQIGGMANGMGNIVSGNNVHGVYVHSASSAGVQVIGNLIGTNPAGTGAVANGFDGVRLEGGATLVTVGGATETERNIISGNSQNGIDLNGVTDCTVQGNYIGTNITGTLDLGNSFAGVSVSVGSTNNLIGGAALGESNLISGNDQEGVLITGAATSNNTVEGNLIGTDITGNGALANDIGVSIINSGGHTIGGSAIGTGNVISGNTTHGILLGGGGTDDIVIQGNLIGTQSNGTGALGNGNYGIRLSNTPSNNLIGGIGVSEGNTIANNGRAGILVLSGSTGNSILGNLIYTNADLGIDLSASGTVEDGVSVNDDGDGDSGGNLRLNFPVINNITQSGSDLDVEFELDVPAGNYRIEFFDNPAGLDPSDHGEGEIFLDFVTVAASPGSTHSITLSGVTPGDILVVTATATEDQGGGNYGNTSEFSSVNSPPVAVDDTYNTNEDIEIKEDVLTNDYDPNGDPLTVSLVTDVTNGTLVLGAQGTFTYTPNLNFHGSDSFVYEVCDDATPEKKCAQATVLITINSVNDAPLAVDDPSETTNEDVPLVSFVLTNDSDVDGDVLTIVSLTQPANGTATNNGNGTITYTPFPNFTGVNTYTYTISDGKGATATATVTVTVGGFNDPPTAALDIVSTLEDMPVIINVLANDFDVDGDPISVSSFALPTNGTLIKNPDDTFTYTPDTNYFGLDTFNYTITDGNGGFSSSSVTIVVAAINDAPTAANDTTTTNEDTAVTLTVVSNDSDIEGDPLQVVIVTQGINGTVTNNNNGSVTYLPFPNFNGNDTFTYTITDGNGGISTASVVVNINPSNDTPKAVDDFKNTEEDTPVSIAVLTNDVDVDGDVINVTGITQPINGTATIGTGGTISYQPNANFNGTDTFTYTISDGNGGTDTGQVTVVVGPINDDPIARNDLDITDEDNGVTTNVLANDEDPIDHDPLEVVAATQPSNGTTQNNGDGTITYQPFKDFNGTDTYMYTITDGKGGTSTATVTIIVLPINDPPVAVLDIESTLEDTPVTTDVVDNDFDVEGDLLNIVAITQGSNGAVVNNGNGTVTYTPNTNFIGMDTYSYTISDGQGGVSTATVSVWVGVINDPPVAIDDIVNTFEDLPVTSSVLDNDSDPDGDPLTIVVVTNPANGIINDNGDGTITYTPNANFGGIDSYTYTITDGNGGTDIGTVNITVSNNNDAPTAVDDIAGTNEDSPVTTDVLVNDSDPEGDGISIITITQGMNGATVDNGDGTITYTPDANFHGVDTYNYTITDGNGGTASATVTVVVNSLQDPPTAVDDIISTGLNTAITSNVLANDFDIDGDALSIVNVVQGTNGIAMDNGNGTITYTPNTGFTGVDIYSYTITDGNGLTSSATVTVYVGISNNPPVAVDDNEITYEDTPVTTNVLNLDSDPDGDAISAIAITQPSNGEAVDNGNGMVTYTPHTNFNGTDSYTYTITDGRGGTATATVTITVTPINDPPIANDDYENTEEDQAVILPVLNNDTDVDGDVLTITGLAQGTNGAVANNGDGTLTYTPDNNFGGTDTFTYTISDGNGGTDIATVTVVVGGVNDAPNAVDDTDLTNEDTDVTTDVLANDSDPEGDPIAIASLTEPANGTVVNNGNGTVTYTPNPNFNGTDTYTYIITDGNGGTAAGLVTITVNPINDPPIAVNDIGNSTDEDIAIIIDVTVNDSDVDGILDLSSITILTPPANGSLVDNGNGTLTYTPNPQYNGSDAFTYTIDDNEGASSNMANVEITIRDINDIPVALNDTVTTVEETPVTIDVAANDSDIDGTIDLASVGTASTPINGTVIINGDGTITYTPDPDFIGLDSLTYTIDDEDGGTSNVATVFITVTNFNDNPIAVNDTLNADEDIQLNVVAPGVLSNDSDVDGDPLIVTGSDAVSTQGGMVMVNSDGSLTYDPPVNFTGSDTFTYSIGDGNGGSATATVVIIVGATNDPPIAIDDIASGDEDEPITGNLLTNDSDPEGNNLSLKTTPVIDPTNGTIVLNSDGTFTYTPNPNFNGADNLTYEVCDDGTPSQCSQAELTITINPVNDDPVAVADNYNAVEDMTLNIPADGVLTNDSDIDGDGLSVTAFDAIGTEGGAVTVSADGSLSYTPPTDFTGADTFTYTIEDGNGGSATALVTITVSGVNDAPTALDDNYTTDENTELSIGAPGVLDNDSDTDGDTFTVSGFDPVSVNGGAVTVSSDGSFEYTPPTDFIGDDTFTYTIDDVSGATATASVTVTVNGVNDPPQAADDNYTTDEEVVLTISDPLLGLLNNDSDPEGDNMTVITIPLSVPGKGSLALNDDGTFIYTPDPDSSGLDTFIYEVCDNSNPIACSQATVTIVINPINDAPIAVDDSYITVENTPINIVAPGLLENDQDVDADNIEVIDVVAIDNSGGTLIWNIDGSFDYTPPMDFTGSETYSYDIRDGKGGTATASITIEILPPNDPPVALADSVNTEEDFEISGNVLVNDSDPNTDNLQVSTTPLSGPTNGSVVLNADGTFTYTPNPGYSGKDSFVYEVCDDGFVVACAMATVFIEVVPFEGLVIYEGVSPNNDNSNDVWVIEGIQRFPNNAVQIFNRWGNKVYQASGYNNLNIAWEGQSTEGVVVGNDIVPDGTYFFVLDLGDGSKAKSGYIVLKK